MIRIFYQYIFHPQLTIGLIYAIHLYVYVNTPLCTNRIQFLSVCCNVTFCPHAVFYYFIQEVLIHHHYFARFKGLTLELYLLLNVNFEDCSPSCWYTFIYLLFK